ncbi:ABC-type ATPase involved in cell division [Flavobacterium sp. 7E]|uniref:dynamin family protein n=1 Tax=Flavobacterium sp. 7E TaxID=2735898 RepID=UPI001571529A|nr:dynamin family protein [Flavobacterium sp. 7E]NRS87747.1 ABC-type ATPase involved in cell division [Flavobacterium sp. 7E]
MQGDHAIIKNKLLNEIKEINNLSFLQADEFSHYRTILSKVKSNLLDSEFRITVVGEFSSGKSTFLNCLIGKDLLPKGAIETTATVTYIHNVKENHDNCDKAIIHFNDTSKNNIEISLKENRNALKEFVSTMSTKLDVAKEVQSVHLYTTCTGLGENVVLIDTPGSNGVASGHKDLAVKEIRNAHASLCLFSLKGLGNSDLAYIKEIGQYQKSMFYVMNFIDHLKLHEGESVESKLKEFKALINEHAYEDRSRNTSVFGISALNALESKNMTRSKEERDQLYANSGIKNLEQELFSYINIGERINDFYNSITHKLQASITNLCDLLEDKKAILDSKINRNDVDLISKKQSHFKSKIEDNKKRMKTSLSSRQGTLETQTIEFIKEVLIKTEDEIRSFIDNQSLESLQDNKQINCNSFVQQKIQGLHQKLVIFLKDHFIEINSNTIEYIQEYIPLVKVAKDYKLQIKILDARPDFSNMDLETKIQKLEKDVITVNIELNQKINDKNTFRNLLDIKLKQLNVAKEEQSIDKINNKADYDRQIIILGSKPQPLEDVIAVEKDRTSIVGRYSVQPLIGKKDVEEIIYSDENVNIWINKKSSLERKFQKQNEESRKIISAFKNAKIALENNLEIAFAQNSFVEKQKQKLERELKSEKSEQEFLRVKAKKEFERSQKKQILEHILDYLTPPNGVIYHEFREISKRNISDNIKRILDLNMKEYDKKVFEYEKKLASILEKTYGNKTFSEIKNVDYQLASIQKHKLYLEQLSN